MSDDDYWENAYEAGNTTTGSLVTPLPSLLLLQPPTYLGEMQEFSTLDRAAEQTVYSWLNAV